MLSLTMKDGDYFLIGDDIKITFSKSSYRGALSVGIDAPKSMKIVRSGLLEKIAAEKAACGDLEAAKVSERFIKEREQREQEKLRKAATTQYIKDKKARQKEKKAEMEILA